MRATKATVAQSNAAAGCEPSGRDARTVRCAIYTRKSTEEGLDQGFNSLDAQREACAAYVLSQAGEGWILLPSHYDDGGYSGGSMDRPGLQRLLGDIARGEVDVVVVYKIDRLTRSLADFSKIVERLDHRGASFVSVTQAFNTTTSMGRLTLNVLLSFAQFEREVGAERVRDKIAASRRKGIWMGGRPPIGYDVRDRKLVINTGEAHTVRHLFRRYLELGSLAKLKAEIEASGILTKSFIARNGRQVGGNHWCSGALRHVLRNPVYIGEAVHKGNAYPGLHDAITDVETFSAVQATLEENRIKRKNSEGRHSPSVLTGLVFDDAGNAMSPQATTKRGSNRRIVYYVSRAILQKRDNRGSLPRVSATRLEEFVRDVLLRLLVAVADRLFQIQPLASANIDLSPGRSLFRTHVRRIVISRGGVALELTNLPLGGEPRSAAAKIEAALTSTATLAGILVKPTPDGLRVTLPVSLAPYATNTSIRRADGWTEPKVKRDAFLIRALVLAHSWKRDLEEGRAKSTEALAAKAKLSRNTVRYLLRLAFLAPDLQRAILDGRQPPHLTVRYALNTVLPCAWDEQRKILGTAPG